MRVVETVRDRVAVVVRMVVDRVGVRLAARAEQGRDVELVGDGTVFPLGHPVVAADPTNAG
jgi:hypothetical protein